MSSNKPSSKPVALVTGGVSFLGRAISLKFAREGFNLAVHYQNSENKARQLASEIARRGGQAFPVKADLRNPQKASTLVRRTVEKFGRLDVLVNNASVFKPTPLKIAKPGMWEEMFRVNVFSPYFLCRAAAPWLKRTSGCVVNLTDIYGEYSILKDYAAYCTSKAALIVSTRHLALQLGPRVRVNAVSPGAIRIPANYDNKRREELIERSALKRQGKPEDIAEAVYFLATQSFITGQVLNVDGGRFL
jgi:pteridine reductase